MDHEALNRMLEARVKDMAARRLPRNPAEHTERIASQRDALAKALGLFPAPPRTELHAAVTGTLDRDGYRIEKVRYESRPGVLVTAHLYLPVGEGPFPLVLSPHGHFEFKKSTPVVQARGIGLACLGFACLIVDSPGVSWDDNEQNERKAMGSHDDPWLGMGSPVAGQYVWDLVRGLDYCESRSDLDTKRVGITGASGGGQAAMLAFAFDDRISAAVPVCQCVSFETNARYGCFCNHVPGILGLGDRADVLAMRAPAPVMLVGASDDPEFPAEGHQKTLEKLKGIYRLHKSESNVRLELVEGKHDYNRRMREAMYAFFAQHLLGQHARGHLAEPRPLTDGVHNPYEAGTEPATSPDLIVTDPAERSTTTFRDLLERGLEEPYPDDFEADQRLAPWGKYGPLTLSVDSTEILLTERKDAEGTNVIVLQPELLELRFALLSGMSLAECLAQILHLHLPGKPEGWEANALGADAISSMIASVKTLMKGTEQPAVAVVRAEGEFASLVAAHLKKLRPALEIEASFEPGSWKDLYATGMDYLVQPGARYLKWPF